MTKRGPVNCKTCGKPQDECECMEDGNWDMGDFMDTMSKMLAPSFEAVVAELIDNSSDENATLVNVELLGKSEEDFAVIVFDDGDGFEDDDDVKAAFDMAGTKNKGDKKIGKFNVGLKAAPLSTCNQVSIVATDPKGNPLHQRIDKNVIQTKGKYGTIKTELKTKAVKHARRKIDSSLNDFRTAVVLSNFDYLPSVDPFTATKYKAYSKHMKQYFGIIYEGLLSKFDLTIDYEGGGTKSLEVIPLDPFFRDLTPAKIDERISLEEGDPRHISEDDRYVMECFREWGTIATPTIPIPIKWADPKKPDEDPITHHVNVTGYCIPVRKMHDRIPLDYKGNVCSNAPPGNPTNDLKAEHMGGLYFYRNGRCICFGDTNLGKESNKGWYKGLINNPEARHDKTRIEIDFPADLDDYFRMSSTKDWVRPRAKFIKLLLSVLKQPIDDPQLRGQLGSIVPFFGKNPAKDANIAVMLNNTLSSDSKQRNQINKDCEYCDGDPKPYHHIKTPCPEWPCEVCDGECGATGDDDCEYECTVCGKTGLHVEDGCDKNCEYCGKHGGHGDKICPNLCDECKKTDGQCECPCPQGCGEDKSHCLCCDECKKPKPCDCKDESEKSTIGYDGDTVYLTLHKGDPSNEELTQQALDHLG